MTTLHISEQQIEQRDALVGRLFQAAISTMEVFTIYLGDRLGLYRALAGTPATAPELSAATGANERYVREWLEQQAAAGILEVENRDAEAHQRRYALPAGHHEVLLDDQSLNYMAGVLRLVAGAVSPVNAVAEAFRSGAGVPYADYGLDTVQGIANMNRPMFLNLLGSAWLPSVPEVHARLAAETPARVADVGCGAGWSSIAIARAYPNVTVDGYDIDRASIELARANAAEAGVADRVTFHLHDASHPAAPAAYDLVTAFETIHDMARPVEALASMRAMLAPGGVVLVADERVGEAFAAPGDDIERLNYGFSVLHCLPASLAEQPSAATGTVMRPPVLRAYAEAAGFARVDILPIENDFWRFYQLR